MKNTFFLDVVFTILFLLLAFLFLKFLLGLVLIVFLIGVFRTWQIQHDSRNKVFLQGIFPSPAPDGLHQGIFLGHNTSWRGKKFDAANAKGINLFAGHNTAPGSDGQVEKYPFKTWQGKGLLDKKLDVLKIDYNVKGNPFWLRLIVDEIVQIAPNEYLGKMNLKIIPGFPFGILYFELKK